MRLVFGIVGRTALMEFNETLQAFVNCAFTGRSTPTTVFAGIF